MEALRNLAFTTARKKTSFKPLLLKEDILLKKGTPNSMRVLSDINVSSRDLSKSWKL